MTRCVVPTRRLIRMLLTEMISRELTLRLFCNPRLPGPDDVTQNYAEADGYGYTSFPLATGKWTFADADDGIQIVYPEQTWRFTGRMGDVYGWYVTDGAQGLLWAELIHEPVKDGPHLRPVPVVIENTNSEIIVAPCFALGVGDES